MVLHRTSVLPATGPGMTSTVAVNRAVSVNRRRALILVAGGVTALVLPAALVVFVVATVAGGLGIGVLVALLAGGAIGAGAAVRIWRRGVSVALEIARGLPADPVAHARLHNVVDGLCVAVGLAKPALLVVDDPAPNVFTVGTQPRRAWLVVTRGLLGNLTRIELEAVIAHELSHVKRGDIVPATVAVGVLGPFLGRAEWAGSMLLWAVGRRREVTADLAAVSVTRYPPGLVAGLEKLRAGAAGVRRAGPATAHLWIEPPALEAVPGRSPARRWRRPGTHPPLDERIQALTEL